MTTLIVLMVLLGFYLLYQTSKKAELNRIFLLEKWAQDHSKASKNLGVIILMVSLGMCMVYMGTGSGIFAYSVILMTVASCVVLFAPLRYVKAWVFSAFFLVSILLELIWV